MKQPTFTPNQPTFTPKNPAETRVDNPVVADKTHDEIGRDSNGVIDR